MSSELPRYFHSEMHHSKIREAIAASKDPHRYVAAWFFDVAYEDVGKEQRSQAKIANYNYLYRTFGG